MNLVIVQPPKRVNVVKDPFLFYDPTNSIESLGKMDTFQSIVETYMAHTSLAIWALGERIGKTHEEIIEEKTNSKGRCEAMTLRGGKSYKGLRMEEKLDEYEWPQPQSREEP